MGEKIFFDKTEPYYKSDDGKITYNRSGRPCAFAGKYEIIRFKIFQMDRLDIWEYDYQYFERGHWDCKDLPRFLTPEESVWELLQSLYDDFFVNGYDEFQGLEGAMLELHDLNPSYDTKCKFLRKEELPRLRQLLERYLPDDFVPKFLKEDQSLNGVTDWWDYS